MEDSLRNQEPYELDTFVISSRIPAGCQLVSLHPAFKRPLPFQMPGAEVL